MSVDIRIYTRIIIRKNKRYLVGIDEISKVQNWSTSPWDAWYTRNADDAKRVARNIGGIAMLFNPVIGRTVTL